MQGMGTRQLPCTLLTRFADTAPCLRLSLRSPAVLAQQRSPSHPQLALYQERSITPWRVTDVQGWELGRAMATRGMTKNVEAVYGQGPGGKEGRATLTHNNRASQGNTGQG
jgi:hypothetical protein